MSKKTKALVSSFVAIAMSASLATGATYALFTSEDKVNIAVTSGTVSVIANIDEDSVQTKQLYDTDYTQGADNMYEGVATFDDDSLTLERFVPGDGIKFNIVVKNESTVSVKYRTIISCENDDGLFAGLKVDIGNLANYNGEEYVAKWESMAVGAQDILVPVSIELPEDAGYEYQDKTCTISYKVEAVQGNAIVMVTDAEQLKAAIESGKSATLTDDITLNAGTSGTFTVAADTKTVIDLGGNDLTVTDAAAADAFLIVEGDLTITGEGNVNVRQINASEGSKLTLDEGVTIETSNSFAINNSGTTEINGATINHTGTNHAIQNQGNGTLIINDATVTSTSTSNISTINSQGGTVTINGGTFTHNGSMGSVIKWLYSNEGEIIINGGTFIQNGGDSLASIDYGDAKLTINGGTFVSASYFAQPMQNIVINAGEFKNNAVVLYNPFMYWTIAHETRGYIPTTSTATTNADGSITVTKN